MAETVLPGIFDIKYYLNGKEFSRRSGNIKGKLEIKITSRRKVPLFYETTCCRFHNSDTDKSSDIHAPDAVLGCAGKNKAAAYTVLPGRDADILKCHGKDFSMAGMEITPCPFP